jgi:hypothetical protein
MASRAIVIGYQQWTIEAQGTQFHVYINSLYTDPTIQGSGALLQADVSLDATAPGGWMAAIKAAVAVVGVANGYPDLVVGQVYAPAYT